MENVIKVCPNPICGEVMHNCIRKPTYCGSCGHRVIEINQATYLKKFVRHPFQVDFVTGERVYPEDLAYDPNYSAAELQQMQEAFDFLESLK